MNSLTVAVFCVVLAAASASHLGIGILAAPHVASGSIGVGPNGAVIAGPAGSVRTDNGLHGHGAAAQLSGPAGDVRTRGGAVALDGPGIGGHGVGLVGGHGVGLVGGPVVGLGGVGLGLGGLGGVGLGGIGLGGVGLGGVGHGVVVAGPGVGIGGLGLGLGHGIGLAHGW